MQAPFLSLLRYINQTILIKQHVIACLLCDHLLDL
jgi:hypothetical protein